jgi:type IV pilus assembly protein PilX
MLTQFPHAGLPARQNGVVLLIALIVLVAMTLAGIALVRSVDTTNIIAGNMAFQQSATQSADAGVETAYAWLQGLANSSTPSTTCAGLNVDCSSSGYTADGSKAANNPAANQSWDAFWTNTLDNRAKLMTNNDGAGNAVSYVIDRLCANAGSPNAGANCTSSPLVTAGTATGNAEEGGEIPLDSPSLVYYRITTRIAGPRNTVSYIQAIVAM